jgi:hypothetical protein
MYLGLQTGSSGEIYIAKWNNEGSTANPDSLAMIQYPNAAGLSCNFIENGVANGGGSEAGLPNFVDSYFRGTWQQPCNVGIEENDLNKSKFNIYPNPSNGIFYINCNRCTEVIIYNALGQRITQHSILKENSPYRFDISSSPNGMYYITIETSSNLYSQKLIINH